MFKIVSKSVLNEAVKKIEISAPEIAKRVKAGQFIMLRVVDKGERIPVTVVARNVQSGTITIIVQEIGKTTQLLGRLEIGDSIKDVLGPLGHSTEAVTGKTVVAIGGGVGVAEILPVSRMYKENNNKVIGIIGARTKDLVILEKEMKGACDELFVTTDDGSYIRKGFVSDVLKELLDKKEKVDIVYAIGPVPMMRAISVLTKPYGVKTIVSLNPIMVDGTGMCGACRVTVGGKTLFACVDGPEFDGHEVSWDELIMRLSMFKVQEKTSIDKFQEDCKCRQKK
jgi:ferredoxin--NADP+ reductase